MKRSNHANSHKNRKTILWITEEWLVILIAILLLLAIAIGAAGARTYFQPPTLNNQPSQQTMDAGSYEADMN